MSDERQFPLLGGVSRIGSVPWWVAEQAYVGYASKYGDSQSLERLAERGGFGIEEMDEFYPEWREKASLIRRLQAELDKHRWIPVGSLPPRSKNHHHSAWYILTDGKEWTVGYYDFPFKRWAKGNSPFDLSMADITHWKPTFLP